MNHRKVLLIGIANSIHTARWIEQFRDSAVDITLIPSTARRSVHPTIRAMSKTEQELKLRLPRFFYAISVPVGCLDLFLDGRLMGLILRIWLRRSQEQFDVVHAMELQHAGYIMLSALKDYSCGRTIATNWGSDIYWFQRFPRHKKKLARLLQISSHYSCECHRDVVLAKSLGFRGRILDVQPNAGPISAQSIAMGRAADSPSQRHRIMVKGYTRFVGRADVALAAISLCAVELRGFEVVVYSSDFKSRRIARRLSKDHGIHLRVLKKYELSHDEMLQCFRESRLYLGVSMSDGISTSLLEALASGTFPIQTSSSCADEWIISGENGFIVDWNQTGSIVEALKRALSDDVMVDNAAIVNSDIALKRLSPASFGDSHLGFYL